MHGNRTTHIELIWVKREIKKEIKAFLKLNKRNEEHTLVEYNEGDSKR